MVAPILAWAGAFLAGSVALFGQHLAKPRLPVYTLQVANLPTLTWLQGQWQTKLSTSVSMHNDNFVEIDVYGLVFDVFYMKTWNGELTHIGQVQDKHLASQTNHTHRTLSWWNPPPLLWQVRPRAPFEALEQLYVATVPLQLWATLRMLLYNVWHSGGHMVVPTTGVAYVKAGVPTQSNAPFAVSLLCDNVVNLWTLQIRGVECALYSLQPGWPAVESTVGKLRQTTLEQFKANRTGSILHDAMSERESRWEDVLRQFVWEESIR